MVMELRPIVWFSEEGSSDVAQLGGKNASLGEMTRTMRTAGIPVPDGFGITAAAYWSFIDENELRNAISSELAQIKSKAVPLETGASRIRKMIRRAQFSRALADSITTAYRLLCKRAGAKDLDVAVRSSATAEDLPEASFAGQHESFLNIRGDKNLLEAIRRCFASLFADRAIIYRENHGFEHMKVGLRSGFNEWFIPTAAPPE